MEATTGTFAVKKGLAQMLKGGVIMDVVTPEHARIAEDAGACAVMALERVPADIRASTPPCRPPLVLDAEVEICKFRLRRDGPVSFPGNMNDVLAVLIRNGEHPFGIRVRNQRSFALG